MIVRLHDACIITKFLPKGKDAAVKHLVRGQMNSDQLYTIRIQLLEVKTERGTNVETSFQCFSTVWHDLTF